MRKTLASSDVMTALLTVGLARAEDVKQYAECGHEPTETDVTAAKGAFQAGNASFDEADYPRAIVYWEDAYRRDCTAHGMLLNLARAYELNGNKPQAIVALKTYVARVPTSPDKDKIERRIEVLNKQMEGEKAQPPAAAPVPAAPAPLSPTTQPAPPPVAPDPGAGKKVPIAPLVVIGAGGAVTIVGVILYATAKSDVSAAEKKCPNRMCPDPADIEAGNSARKRVLTGGVLSVGGVLVAGAGLAWYFLTPRGTSTSAKNETERALTPVAGPGFYGLSYAGRF
jgi:hypothetical protein